MTNMQQQMSDAELSKKLGSYQKTESIGILLGVLLVIAGCVSMFIQRNVILVCALVFPGVALFLLVAKPAQNKKKALLQQQLGGYFHEELTRAFGPEPEAPELPIDWAYLQAAKLSTISFTECTVTDFHEGEHKGLRFSAANVELRRTVEEKSGPDNDNWMTRTETLFRGIVVLLPLLEHIVQGDVQRRVTDVLAADHDAAEQRLGSGHPVVVVGAGLFLHGAAQLHVGRREPQPLVRALVKVCHGTLRKGDCRQLCRLQVRPVDGQRGRLRLRAEGFCQFRAEEAAQLLLHQRFFLRLGGFGYQQEQCHARECQSADKKGVTLYKH